MTQHNPTPKVRLKVRGCELVEVLDNAGFDEGKFVPSIVSGAFPIAFSNRQCSSSNSYNS